MLVRCCSAVPEAAGATGPCVQLLLFDLSVCSRVHQLAGPSAKLQ
jgi:hypothetical protein